MFKYVAKTNLIVVVVILVVIFVVARQFERSTTILKNWCHASRPQSSTHTAVFIELLRN